MIESVPRTIEPGPLEGLPPYRVPGDKRAQLISLRAGNASGELIVLVLMRFADTELEVGIAAPAGLPGVAALDMGLMEICRRHVP